MQESNVLEGPWKQKVVPLPRDRFGLKKALGALRDAIELALASMPVCSTRDEERAAQCDAAAFIVAWIAETAKNDGDTRTAAKLRHIQHQLETLSAEVTS